MIVRTGHGTNDDGILWKYQSWKIRPCLPVALVPCGCCRDRRASQARFVGENTSATPFCIASISAFKAPPPLPGFNPKALARTSTIVYENCSNICNQNHHTDDYISNCHVRTMIVVTLAIRLIPPMTTREVTATTIAVMTQWRLNNSAE